MTSGEVIPLPSVFRAPIRTDIVSTVHMDMLKNTRQPYAVSKKAGTFPCLDVLKIYSRHFSFVVRSVVNTTNFLVIHVNHPKDTRRLLNHGELVEQLLVFLVSVEVVPTEVVREPSVTCVEVEGCLLQPRPTANGTGTSTRTRRGMPSAPPLPLQESLESFRPKVGNSILSMLK